MRKLFSTLDDLIWYIFAIEVFTKFFAGGLRPFQYFYGPEWKWNNFDFTIVILSIPTSIMDPFFQGSGSIALLRLVRLARLGKLIKKIPQLQMIMRGLLGGLSSIGYIILLLFLVFYLYAVVGYYYFKGNDPFHFKTLADSLATLFRIATLANWGDIMYLNMYGCDVYPVYDYYDPEGDDGPPDDWRDLPMYECRPESSEVFAPFFFISFVVISALVMLSLFIGAVTMSMTDSMDELKRITEEKKRMITFERNRQKILNIMSASENVENEVDEDGNPIVRGTPKVVGRRSSLAIAKHFVHRASMGRMFSDDFAPPKDYAKEHAEHKARMKYCLQHALGDIAFEERKKEEELRKSLELNQNVFAGYYELFCDVMKAVSVSPYFKNFVTFIIIVAGINVGVGTDTRITDWKSFCGKEGRDDLDETECPTLDIVDLIILAIFIVEFVVKFFAEKWKPLVYFKDPWNKFDFFIVAFSIFELATGMGGQVAILRLLRLLRVLKLVKSFKKLAIIVNALMMGLGSIGYVGVILFLTFYVFAILGIILFKPNDPWHFGSLHDAMITLFRASTLDDWAELMYLEMHGCKIFPEVYEDFPVMCSCNGVDGDDCSDYERGIGDSATWWIAYIYFTIFIVIAAQVLLTLFIGVISTSMDQARDDKKEEEELEKQLAKVGEERGLDNSQIESFREVFDMLDLDRGGTIEEEELMIGLSAVQDDMAPYEVQEILRKVDPKNEGVNLVGFIEFMCLTPKYRENAAAHRALLFWKKTGKVKKNVSPWQQWWQDIKTKYMCHSKAYLDIKRMEAAMIIQSAWRAKLEFKHDQMREKSEGETRAYAAMQDRLKRAEDILVEKEKGNMAGKGSPQHATSLEMGILTNVVEQQEDRKAYGNELAGENRARKQSVSKPSPKS